MEQDLLEQIQGRDVHVVVCTDSEAILGIGDQGVGVSPRAQLLMVISL
jgi:malate dehydrogenase (oxaloacetate-decarboxylating)